MKILKYEEAVAYANSFVSFILTKKNIKKYEIILFGSVARGEADENSDVDLFFNLDKTNKREIEETKYLLEKELKKFYKTETYKKWRLKGIKNTINIEIGNLEEWDLKRSITSEGITLYGKYKSYPQNTEGYLFFKIDPIKNITKRNRVLRKLFGRKEKEYRKEGLLTKNEGKKISANSFIVPLGKTQEITSLLKSEKVNFTIFEFWTDKI